MIQGYTPAPVETSSPSMTDTEQLIMAGKIIGVVAIIALVIWLTICIVKAIKAHNHRVWGEWKYTSRYLKDDNNGEGYQRYICLPFKQFHDYYSLNPERYELKEASVYVRRSMDPKDDRDFKYIIIFTKREYRKYAEWVKKSTNGMHDPRAVEGTLSYLQLVQSDIQAIRDKEAHAVSESQKAMKQFMDGLKGEPKLDLTKDILYPLGKPADSDGAKWPEWVEE